MTNRLRPKRTKRQKHKFLFFLFHPKLHIISVVWGVFYKIMVNWMRLRVSSRLLVWSLRYRAINGMVQSSCNKESVF